LNASVPGTVISAMAISDSVRMEELRGGRRPRGKHAEKRDVLPQAARKGCARREFGRELTAQRNS
jgi:hypothetical protein